MESEESFNDILNKNRVEIVKRLHLERTFHFDYLLSKSVFDGNDCDLIRAQPTREGKASKFLDILEMKGPDGFVHFVNALQVVNPNLYELLTGEKATTKPSPIIMNGYSSSADNNFVDVEILSNYAKRVTGDIQDITIRYDQVLKEIEQLQRALNEAQDKFHYEQRQKETLQQKLAETEELLTSNDTRRAQHANEQFAHHLKCVHEDSDTKQFIIQLQMRLLAAQDENENERRQMMETLKQVDRSSQDREICATLRLSQKLISHSEEMKVLRERRCRSPGVEAGCPHIEELQYEISEKKEEMRDLKNWTEALKMRFDIALQERNGALQTREDLAQECSKLMDDLSQLEIKFNRIKRENDDVKKSCNEQEENAATYRKQRDFHERQMKEALIKRDQAIHELHETTRRFKEELEFKERTIRQQTGDERTFEKQCREMNVELCRVRTELRETLQANEELRTTVAALQSQRTTCTSRCAAAQAESEMEDSEQSPESESQINSQHEPGSNTSSLFSTEERETTAVVDSIKRRVWENTKHAVTKTRPNLRKSKSLDTMLSELVPAYDNLSPEAKNSFSLDRVTSRQVLPYQTIVGMWSDYPLSASPSRSLPCEAAKERTRRMTEPSTSEMDDMFTFADLGGGSGEISEQEGREEENIKDAIAPLKSSRTQDSSPQLPKKTHRPRSGAIVRRNVGRFISRRPSEESQELSD